MNFFRVTKTFCIYGYILQFVMVTFLLGACSQHISSLSLSLSIPLSLSLGFLSFYKWFISVSFYSLSSILYSIYIFGFLYKISHLIFYLRCLNYFSLYYDLQMQSFYWGGFKHIIFITTRSCINTTPSLLIRLMWIYRLHLRFSYREVCYHNHRYACIPIIWWLSLLVSNV